MTRVFIEGLPGAAVFTTTTIYVTDIDDDEYFTGKKVATVQFLLPTGSYATMLVKQLMETLTEKV